jgi:hypothetical protein
VTTGALIAQPPTSGLVVSYNYPATLPSAQVFSVGN